VTDHNTIGPDGQSDAFDRRLQEAARSLAPESLPDGILDVRLADTADPRPRRLIVTGMAGLAAVFFWLVATGTLQVATSTPTPIPSNPSASPVITSPTPAPSTSPAPPVVVTADLILGGANYGPFGSRSCSNGPDGYSLSVPAGWYTNRARDEFGACQYLDDQPFRVENVVHTVIRLRVERGRLSELLQLRDKSGIHEDATIQLADGTQAMRRVYEPEFNPQVAYFVPLDGTELDPDAEVRYLIATTEDSERYATAAPILAEIVDSVSVNPRWKFEATHRQAVDDLFANAATCTPANDSYTVSYPASWSAGSGDQRCHEFSPNGAATAQVSIEVSEGAYGSFARPIGNEDLVVSGSPAIRHELVGVSELDPDPSVRTYEFLVYLGNGSEIGPNLRAATGTREGGDYDLNSAILDRMVSTLRLSSPASDFTLVPDPNPDLGGTVAASRDGLVVTIGSRCSPAGTCRNPAWSSTDGTHWSSLGDLPGGRDVVVNAMAASDLGWVALGPGHAWFSGDGRDWVRVDGRRFGDGQADGGPTYQAEGGCCGAQPASVIATKNGFVAVGAVTCFKCLGRAAVWLSVDGRSWQRMPYQPSFDAGPMTAVAQLDGGRLVAVGTAAWTSDDDGRSWNGHSLAGEDVRAISLLRAGSGLVAVGGLAEGIQGAVWTSPNGDQWQQALPIEMKGLDITTATVWRGSVLVAGWDESRFLAGNPLVVFQQRASGWRRLTVAPDDHGRINAFARLNDLLVAVGDAPKTPGIWTRN
jgi:hypothetical protein